jgi:hypothetical protein
MLKQSAKLSKQMPILWQWLRGNECENLQLH